ncbi:MAG: hypothetical protein AAGA68_23300 [Pseudomonadota bacterium]
MTRPRVRMLGFQLWVIAWASALLLVFTQGYFMSRQWWLLPAGIALCAACLWGGRRWGTAIARQRFTASNVLRLVAVLHLLPLGAQLTALGDARWDNLLLALVGWALLEAAGWPQRPHIPAGVDPPR